MAPAPSAKLRSCEIQAPLGMGEVYCAREPRLDRTVAITVLPTHLPDTPQRRERFEREAKAISALSHPSTCALTDIGHQGLPTPRVQKWASVVFEPFELCFS
jgi:serine/threonine protein kinase